MNLNELIEKAKKSTVDETLKLLDNVLSILENERKGKNGEALHHLPNKGNGIVIGDLHGDLESLSLILRHSKFAEKRKGYLIFLGDYGDRGPYSVEVYFVVLTLKKEFPDCVILLRGNHEFPLGLSVYPHDLPVRLIEKYGDEGIEVYEKLRYMFEFFDNGAIVEGKYLMLHGGIPSETRSLGDIAFAHKTHPSKSYLEEIIWNDPRDNVQGFYPSPRGAGKIFGKDATEKVLRILGVKTLIRSHEACEGVDVRHDGKVLTVFSRRGPPYHNSCGAYLKIDLSEEARDAYELSKMAYKF